MKKNNGGWIEWKKRTSLFHMYNKIPLRFSV